MVKLDINQATASDMTNKVSDYSVTPQLPDSYGDQRETEYQNPNWSTYWGYFNQVPDLKSALLLMSTWNVGKGYTTDDNTQVILDHISGWGKDSFDDILFNMDLVSRINGDSFAEIVRDEKTDVLLNLKPIDPSSIKIIVDERGIIKRYEQTSKIKGIPAKKFKPEDIFHLCHNRLSDQIHGISDIEGMENTIKADMESFADVKKLMHHQVKPFILWKLKTDDPTKINAFVAKIDRARNLGEDMFIPDDDDAVQYEIVQISPSQVVLAWRDDIRNRFYRNIGLPQVVPGASGQSTESESKVIYLAFEQIVEHRQRYIEKQIWNQLFLRINLYPPASIAPDLSADQAKDPQAFIPSDTQAGANPNG